MKYSIKTLIKSQLQELAGCKVKINKITYLGVNTGIGYDSAIYKVSFSYNKWDVFGHPTKLDINDYKISVAISFQQ